MYHTDHKLFWVGAEGGGGSIFEIFQEGMPFLCHNFKNWVFCEPRSLKFICSKLIGKLSESTWICQQNFCKLFVVSIFSHLKHLSFWFLVTFETIFCSNYIWNFFKFPDSYLLKSAPIFFCENWTVFRLFRYKYMHTV